MGTMTEEQLDLFIPAPPRKPTGEGDCPGYDKCPISICGCRWLGTGDPYPQEKGKNNSQHSCNRNDNALLLNHRQAITQAGTK